MSDTPWHMHDAVWCAHPGGRAHKTAGLVPYQGCPLAITRCVLEDDAKPPQYPHRITHVATGQYLLCAATAADAQTALMQLLEAVPLAAWQFTAVPPGASGVSVLGVHAVVVRAICADLCADAARYGSYAHRPAEQEAAA